MIEKKVDKLLNNSLSSVVRHRRIRFSENIHSIEEKHLTKKNKGSFMSYIICVRFGKF